MVLKYLFSLVKFSCGFSIVAMTTLDKIGIGGILYSYVGIIIIVRYVSIYSSKENTSPV